LSDRIGLMTQIRRTPTLSPEDAAAFLLPDRLEGVLDAFAGEARSPIEAARDETLWREVQQAFTGLGLPVLLAVRVAHLQPA
jgi:hypothetical protein